MWDFCYGLMCSVDGALEVSVILDCFITNYYREDFQ